MRRLDCLKNILHFALSNFSQHKIISKFFKLYLRPSNFFFKYKIFSKFFIFFDSVVLFQVKHLVLKIGENILTKISWNPIFSDSE